MAKVDSVDEYIAEQPEGVQDKLKALRQLVKDEAPQATEQLSHGMPSYKQDGQLAMFGAQKGHITLMLSADAISSLGDELSGYETTKSAVKFPLDDDLPADVIRKAVAWQAEHNSQQKK